MPALKPFPLATETHHKKAGQYAPVSDGSAHPFPTWSYILQNAASRTVQQPAGHIRAHQKIFPQSLWKMSWDARPTHRPEELRSMMSPHHQTKTPPPPRLPQD